MKSSAEGSAGLYIHVPFCPKICPYCDFAVLKAPERMHRTWLDGILSEWDQNASHYSSWRTLYFGGGTPTLVSPDLIEELLQALASRIPLEQLEEMSIEANPETLDTGKIQRYQELGFSRMTLGIQSFDAQRLKWLGRNHGPEVLEQARLNLKKRTFDLGLDLIFGYQGQSWNDLLSDLEKAMEFHPEHISLYGLSIEENTLFAQKQRKGQMLTLDDAYEEHFLKACDFLARQGFVQYELSNFALPGHESKHNQSYWEHRPYLGLGPGAHSLLGRQRIWNPKSFNGWLEQVQKRTAQAFEELNDQEWANEWIWLQLRQAKGLALSDLNSSAQAQALKWASEGALIESAGRLRIAPKEWHRMDEIASSLMNE